MAIPVKIMKMFKKATLEAKKSKMKHKHGCIIAKGTKIYSKGYNHYIDDEKSCTLHSEMFAIYKMLKRSKNKLQRMTMYIVRVGPRNNFKYSKPCMHCLLNIKKYKIRKIIYTTNNFYCEEFVNETQSKHESHGYRYLKKIYSQH